MHQLERMESEDPREQISFTLVIRKGFQSSAYQTPAASLESVFCCTRGKDGKMERRVVLLWGGVGGSAAGG